MAFFVVTVGSENAPAFAPDGAHHGVVVPVSHFNQAHLHQIGPQAGCDLAAVVQTDRVRWVAADGGDCLRQAHVAVVRQTQRSG